MRPVCFLRTPWFLAMALVALGLPAARAQVVEEWVHTTALSTAVPDGAYDGFGDLYVDAAGNAYLTGATRNAQPVRWLDIFTVKVAPDGTLLWAATYDGPMGYDDSGVALRADAAGNVYVAGTSQGDLVTLKYAPDGTLLWEDRQARTNDEASDARRLELSPDGAIYVMGGAGSLRLEPARPNPFTHYSFHHVPLPAARSGAHEAHDIRPRRTAGDDARRRGAAGGMVRGDVGRTGPDRQRSATGCLRGQTRVEQGSADGAARAGEVNPGIEGRTGREKVIRLR